jgi:sodium/potassium-transporting ATPase subunit alpha
VPAFRGARHPLPSVRQPASLILAIVYTPAGNATFGTLPLGAEAWLPMVALALAIGVLEELRKLLARPLS